jgi:3',5'-cyclic AMP phosphodiesterase CpdA
MDGERLSRRDFMKIAGLGGLVFASGLPGCATRGQAGAQSDFFFVQLSDVHWGYNNPKVNPEARTSLRRAIAAVNRLEEKPDFVVFTGDLTQTTDDPKVRRQRLAEFREQAAELKVPAVRFFAGEHDASLDRGEAYQEVIGGPLRYTFDHKGVHFIVLDNTSDPAPVLGAAQVEWLKADLAQRKADDPIVVLTHRPLFPLLPQWDWATRDGMAAVEALLPYRNVVVFYGHIHHEHHHRTGHIEHHAARSLMFPLSPVGTAAQKTQLPWNPAQPFDGLGFRGIHASATGAAPRVREQPLAEA